MKIFLSLLFLFPAVLFAQVNPIIDSLENLIETNPHDTVKVLTKSELCWEYRIIDQKKALQNGQEAVFLARSIDYKTGLGKSLNDLSIIYIDKGSLDTAGLLLEEAKIIRLELNDSAGVAAIHNKLGIIYEHLVRLEEAMVNHLAALEYYESIDNKANMGFCLNNIGNVHFKMKNYLKAEEVHQQALDLRTSINDYYGIAGSHSNLANLKTFTGDTVKAIYHYDQAIKVYRENEFENDLAVTLNNLGSLYLGIDLKLAEKYVKEAFEIRLRLNDARGISSSSILMGDIYMEQGNFSAALKSLHTGLSLSVKSGFENKEKGAYEKLAKLHSKLNNADSTYYYYSKFYEIEKNQYESNLSDQVNELQTVYETEKKDKANEILARINAEETAKRKTADLKVSSRNNIIIIISSITILILLASLLLFQRRKKIAAQEKNIALQIERDKGLKAVFNAQEEERSRISKDLHDGIGQQLSGIKLAWSSLSHEIKNEKAELGQKLGDLTSILDKSANEVRELSHQMMPRSLADFGLSVSLKGMLEDSFKFSEVKLTYEDLNLNERRFSDEIELAAFRVSQEIINNSIKHAQASEITFQIYMQGDTLFVLIEDNGLGFDLNLAKNGLGLTNMKSRLQSINGKLNIQSSDKGTAVSFQIPVK
ncbi:MAG: sensor histidine kinase [Crocinitomicaceae bacterium]